eukprot:jgi/Chrpa1/20313/Chrysochromulina_OHIO_Genome00021173-RA
MPPPPPQHALPTPPPPCSPRHPPPSGPAATLTGSGGMQASTHMRPVCAKPDSEGAGWSVASDESTSATATSGH